MAILEIKGDIISNEDKWIYDWLDWDSTAPMDADRAIATLSPGENLEVLINSGGGSVMAGQEIYSKLKRRNDVTIEIQSLAGSAASVIAMAGKSKISPVGMIMIHNVLMNGASGDCKAMEKNAEILQRMNEALASAYVEKTGMALQEALDLMDKETWLTARQCVEYGFVDEIAENKTQMINTTQGMKLTDDIRKRVMEERNQKEQKRAEILKDLDMYGV